WRAAIKDAGGHRYAVDWRIRVAAARQDGARRSARRSTRRVGVAEEGHAEPRLVEDHKQNECYCQQGNHCRADPTPPIPEPDESNAHTTSIRVKTQSPLRRVRAIGRTRRNGHPPPLLRDKF